MASWGVFGHEWAVDQLQRSLRHGRVRHAYLITGPESVGKETLARAFAMALNCLQDDPEDRPCGECRVCRQILSGSHADVLYSQADPGTGTLKIEEIRSLAAKTALKPYDARYRIAIYRDFDRAQPRAQDALLKTLEEPAPTAVLILLAQSPESILPTITSRSQMLHLRPVPAETIERVLIEQYGSAPEQAELLAAVCGGRIGWAIRALQDENLLEQRQTALSVLESLIEQSRIQRFAIAESMAKDKLAVPVILELWASYWRDLIHLVIGSGVPIANRDYALTLHQLARVITQEEAQAALLATQQMMKHLDTNANVRLALETMFLDYPGLKRA